MTSLCIASVMMSSLVSRLKEIGIRIAVGYSINQIQKLFITEVLFIILMSSLLASIFAVCTINLSSSLLSDLAPDGYYVSFPIIVLEVKESVKHAIKIDETKRLDLKEIFFIINIVPFFFYIF